MHQSAYVNGALSKEYIYAGSQLLATLSSSGVPTYHHPDHLSIRVNSDSAGTLIGQQGHYPFGESLYSQSTTTKWQFTSYERDPESSLDYAIFRYHSSRLGRFQTPDLLAGSAFNPQSLNRYSYVLNDPINRIDPFGLDHMYPFNNWFSAEYGHNNVGMGFWGLMFGAADVAFWGWRWFSLPGNIDEFARLQFRFRMIRATGCDPAFPERCQAQEQDDPAERARQEACANELVTLLIAQHAPALAAGKVNVSVNPQSWKIKFTVTFAASAPVPYTEGRFGQRPGFEISGTMQTQGGEVIVIADVDAWQFQGDVASGFMHIFGQVLREKLTGKAEKPCDLLEAAKK